MKKKNNNLFLSSGYYVLGSFLDRIVPFVVLPIIRNKVSLEDYGLFSLVLLISIWADKILASPMANSIQRYYHLDDRKNAKTILYTGLSYVFCCSIIFFLIVIFFSGNKDLIPKIFIDINVKSILTIAFIVLLRPMSNLFVTYIRVSGNASKLVLMNAISGISTAVSQVIFVSIFDDKLYALTFGFLIGSSVRLIIGTLMVNLNFKEYVFSKLWLIRMSRFGYPLLITSGVTLYLETIEKEFITTNLGLKYLGIYVLVQKLPSILDSAIFTPLKNSIIPFLYSQESSKQEQLENSKLSISLTLLIGIISVPFWIIILPYLCKYFFLIDYSIEIEQILVLLISCVLIFSTGSYFGLGLNMLEKTKTISIISILRLTIFAIVLYLTKFLGILAVPISLLISNIFKIVLTAILSKIYYGLIIDNLTILILFCYLSWIVLFIFGFYSYTILFVIVLLCIMLIFYDRYKYIKLFKSKIDV